MITNKFFNASVALSAPRSGNRNKYGIKQLPMDEPVETENPKLWAEGDRKKSNLSFSPSTFISGYYAKNKKEDKGSCGCEECSS